MPQKFQILKNRQRFSKSSAKWLLRQVNDEFVVKAKQQGWRCRAAFKLIEINEKFKIFGKDKIVVDLGSAPGGWSQYAVQKVGLGNVLAIDLLAMPAIAGVHFLQLDFLDEDSVSKIEAKLLEIDSKKKSDAFKARKIKNSELSSQNSIKDFSLLENTIEKAAEENLATNQNEVFKLRAGCNVLLSDMAANATGDRNLDHIRIISLLEESLQLTTKILKPGGSFVGKVFQGGSSDLILQKLRSDFAKIHYFKPRSSRQDSRENYLVALDFKKTKNN